MKKLYAVLGLVLFLSACQKSEDELIPNVVFKKDNPRVEVSSDGRSATVTVSPAGEVIDLSLETNVELSARSAADWCVSAVKGGVVSLDIDPYEVDTDRETQVELLYQGAVMAKLSVIQSGAATLEVEVGDKASFPSAGGSQTMTLKTNQMVWDVTATESWLTIEKGIGEFTLTAALNEKGGERKTTVTVVAGEGDNTAERVFEVIQNDRSFVIELTLPESGCTVYTPIWKELDCTVDWGDGSPAESIKGLSSPLGKRAPEHTYGKAGVYYLTISGAVEEFYTGSFGLSDAQRGYFTRIVRWGNLSIKSMNSAFQRCPNIVSIPNDTDGSFAETTSFQSAFERCLSLASIPEGLFRGCTDVLTTVNSCFSSCESLTTIPEKLLEPIASLAKCEYLFSYCKKLSSVPVGLFAPLKKATSFKGLFSGCESLETVPAGLFDANTEVVDFSSAFFRAGLKSLPDRLFSKNTKVQKFINIFTWTPLESIPENLFEGCVEVLDFQYVFAHCPNIKSVPAGVFRTNTKVTIFWGVFNDTGITTVPETVFAACPDVKTFQYAFWNCPLLKTIPAKLFEKNIRVTNFYGAFRECPMLETLPAGLFATCTEVTDFTGLCQDSPGIKTIPVSLFDNNRKAIKFGTAFKNCTQLTGESPYTMVDGVKVHLYERLNYTGQFTKPTSFSGAFAGCTQLSDWAAIEAAKWK